MAQITGDQEHELLKFWLRGDADAVAMCEDIFEVSQILDDLIDRDRPVEAATVARMAMLIFSKIRRNPFYRANRDMVDEFLETGLMYYLDSTVLETQDEAGQRLAFVFRDIIGGLVNKCALVIGGIEWWETISRDVYRKSIHDESFAEYVEGLKR